MGSVVFVATAAMTRFLQAIPIASILYVLGRLFWTGIVFAWTRMVIIDLWMLVEVCFFFYQCLRYKKIQQRYVYYQVDDEARRHSFRMALEVAQTDLEGFLSRWFLGAKVEDVYYDNMIEWLAGAFFSAEVSELTPMQRAEVEEQLDVIQSHIGKPLHPGYNPAVSCIRQSVDPVPMRYRPLIIYLSVAAVRLAAIKYMHSCGFKTRRIGLLSYHVWEPSIPAAQRGVPLVFVHGIGIGVSPYTPLILRIRQLMLKGDMTPAAIFLTEMPYVSMSLNCQNAPPPERVVHDMESMIRYHGYERAVFAGHSLGTAHVAWMVKMRPNVVAGSVFIDPIVFLLCRADVAFNFLYRTPSRWNEEIIHYFASSEMGISQTLRRDFCWISNSLWPEHVTSPTVVALSSDDGIVPSPYIEAYLRSATYKAPLDIIYMEGIKHAGFLGSPQHLNDIVQGIRDIMEGEAHLHAKPSKEGLRAKPSKEGLAPSIGIY